MTVSVSEAAVRDFLLFDRQNMHKNAKVTWQLYGKLNKLQYRNSLKNQDLKLVKICLFQIYFVA